MKYAFLSFFIIIVVAVAGWYAQRHFSKKDTHFHSAFEIYINGKKQDYSNPRFMSLVPCSDSNGQIHTKDKVHLHDDVGDVVHVHQQFVVWNDLFSYIHLNINQYKTVTGFVNGKKIDKIGHAIIHPYDSLVLLLDTSGDYRQYLKNAPTKAYIHDVETRNGLCKG